MTEIIVLNWNGGSATLRCLEAICDLPEARVVLVDNASSDNSCDLIEEWCRQTGRLLLCLNAHEVGQLSSVQSSSIVLVRSSENLGFAKGVNLVLEPLLRCEDLEFVWLLNNDAIAAPDALAQLVKALHDHQEAGFAGSMIMDARKRQEIQCYGVRYYPWLGVSKMLYKGMQLQEISKEVEQGDQVDFQHGASLLVRVDLLRKIGLLDEHFFLYSEEHDWQTRGIAAGFVNLRVAESKVYHEGSMSTAHTKHLFYYYYCCSSVYYSRKHHVFLRSVVATICLTGITALRTRLYPKSMYWAMKGMVQGWRKRILKPPKR